MSDNQDDVQVAKKLAGARKVLEQEIHKVIIGQNEVIEELLVAMFCRAHVLIVGVPGLGKTLLVKTLAEALNLSFNRVQFTPDLMPSDITGTDILEEDQKTRERSFRFVKGPIFSNIILADEINRTPPKTQASLLEAMQEGQVTAGGVRYELPQPFFVLATQNPIEQEGTYPLPEAQLDRFMFNIMIDYPDEAEEREIVRATTGEKSEAITPILSAEQIMLLQKLVRRIPVPDTALDYAIKLARSTRPKEKASPDFVKEWVSWGAGPRAGQHMVLAGKARAVLSGRFAVDVSDIQKVALPVLRHRVVTNFNADSEGVSSDDIIKRLIREIK
ncbi:MAG: MoxR family ATPase [Planctomycetes bacterium]|nr:MoxR family ATPase [Planctomycetota bacterium]